MTSPHRPDERKVPGDERVQRPMRPLSHYEIFGPFELPLAAADGALDISPRAPERFWAEVNGRESGLGEAYGCFVFSVRGHNWRQELPWYVGRAERRPFLASCLDEARTAIYSEVLAQVPHVAACLHLISRMTPGGRFSKLPPDAHGEIGFIESLLVGAALGRNSRLSLDQEQARTPALSIPGLLNPQKQRLTIDARALRSVLGL